VCEKDEALSGAWSVLEGQRQQIADLTAKLAEAKRERDAWIASAREMSNEVEKLRAEVARLKADAITAQCEWEVRSGVAETRLRELREALTTIKEIVSDKFLHKHEKLEVIESRCDISLCNEALAKSAEHD
jgi:chromosome segregation ATPase